MRNSRKVFSVLKAVLAVTIVALAGAGSYVFVIKMEKQKLVSTDTSLQNSASSTESAAFNAPTTKEIIDSMFANEPEPAQIAPASTTNRVPMEKTYRDDVYGFEFNYPNESKLEKARGNRWRGTDKLLLKAIELYEDAVIVSIYDNPAGLGVKEWIAVNKDNFKDQGCGLVSTENVGDWRDSKAVLVGGASALLGDVGCCCGFGIVSTVVSGKNRIYFIETVWGVEENPVYNRILSTFKLIEPQALTLKNISGTYSYGNSYKNGVASGILYVKQTSQNEIFFSLEIVIPRGNFGILLEAKAKLYGNRAVYEEEIDESDIDGKPCIFELLFTDGGATISAAEGGTAYSPNCGKGNWGAEVGAIGVYKKISDEVPEKTL
ncbi:MAG: hypothetical protein MUD10_02505 [Candidatus Pacebacteria bacterium]|nr:hypothetical protein [Candidatus Paceibacterota bacterium]